MDTPNSIRCHNYVIKLPPLQPAPLSFRPTSNCSSKDVSTSYDTVASGRSVQQCKEADDFRGVVFRLSDNKSLPFFASRTMVTLPWASVGSIQGSWRHRCTAKYRGQGIDISITWFADGGSSWHASRVGGQRAPGIDHSFRAIYFETLDRAVPGCRHRFLFLSYVQRGLYHGRKTSLPAPMSPNTTSAPPWNVLWMTTRSHPWDRLVFSRRSRGKKRGRNIMERAWLRRAVEKSHGDATLASTVSFAGIQKEYFSVRDVPLGWASTASNDTSGSLVFLTVFAQVRAALELFCHLFVSRPSPGP